MGKQKRIAVFRFGHIGDTIVGLPAMWTIRKFFPNDHIVYLTQQHLAGSLAQGTELLKEGILYDETFTYTLEARGVPKLQALKIATHLRLCKIDVLIYLPPKRTVAQIERDLKFFRLAGVKNVLGIQSYLRQAQEKESELPLPTVINEADRLLLVLSENGISTGADPSKLMDIGLSDEERGFARNWIATNFSDSSNIRIGIGPGSKMPSKRWALDRFSWVAQQLQKEFDAEFIVFGGQSEREECQSVTEKLSRCVNAAGELTVRQSAAVFEHCDLYIGNDTGTMHLAVVGGVQCIGVFAARDWPGRWYPYGTGNVVHRVPVPCEGCMLEVCDKNNLCLDLISKESVLQSCREVLSSKLDVRG